MEIFFIGLLGLCVGSFLNLAIYRLPKMLQCSWRAECKDFLKLPAEPIYRFNLWYPRSHCPHCKQTIHARYNIPILSYLFLHGKCAYCYQTISIRYPIIESISCIMAVLIGWRYGLTWTTAAGLIFSWGLLWMSVIDLDHYLLPDQLTLPLLWLGLLLSLFHLFTDPVSAIIGAAAGYSSLWLIATLFRLISGKVGMGNGDFKLLAMLGAWLGWQALPFIILFASVSGLLLGLGLILLKKHSRNTPIPFGPHLAFAGWVTWFCKLYLLF